MKDTAATLLTTIDGRLELLDRLEKRLRLDHGVIPVVGLESEFYLPDTASSTADIGATLPPPLLLKKERGHQQYELVFPATHALRPLVTAHDSIANRLTQQFAADFSSKPLPADYGSSIQINLSLHNNTTTTASQQIFSTAAAAASASLDPESTDAYPCATSSQYFLSNCFSSQTIDTNSFLKSSIAGILALTTLALPLLLAANPEQISRFATGAELMAPTALNWGVNNRDAAIRIPDSSDFQRRIEYRIGGASMDLAMLIIICLAGTLHGLNHRLIPPVQSFCRSTTADSTQSAPTTPPHPLRSTLIQPSPLYSPLALPFIPLEPLLRLYSTMSPEKLSIALPELQSNFAVVLDQLLEKNDKPDDILTFLQMWPR